MADANRSTDPTFEQRVRVTAYFLWQAAGSPEGRDQEFWYKSLQQHVRVLTADGVYIPERHDFLSTWDE